MVIILLQDWRPLFITALRITNRTLDLILLTVLCSLSHSALLFYLWSKQHTYSISPRSLQSLYNLNDCLRISLNRCDHFITYHLRSPVTTSFHRVNLVLREMYHWTNSIASYKSLTILDQWKTFFLPVWIHLKNPNDQLIYVSLWQGLDLWRHVANQLMIVA